MANSLLIEVFARVLFSFTRGVAEHYDPDEPEVETFGYNESLSSEGREWNCQPVDKPIYQEYSPPSDDDYDLLSVDNSRVKYRVIDASSPDEDGDEQQNEDDEMAWKRFRPSVLRTVCQSMYIGALISLLTAVILGLFYIMISYVSSEPVQNWQFHPKETIPVKIQWIGILRRVIGVAFLYMWFSAGILFLFRPYQLKGVKRKLILVAFVFSCVDTVYRVVGISHYKFSVIPLYVIFLISICCQIFLLTNHFRNLSSRATLFIKLTTPYCFTLFLAIFVKVCIYPMYNKQNERGKLLVALFSPLFGVIFKVILRLCAQRLKKIAHPGYSYILLVPLYFGSAIMFRVMQAELENIKLIAVLGIIHGAVEVLERSTVVFVDHICHVILKRKLAPWGSLRTPRRERLMADIAILSMLCESTAIVSVNGVLYLYQFTYLQKIPFLKLLQEFVIHTAVALMIQWFFTGVSLAIETRFQNIAVMAVWRKRWKRHIFVAMANLFIMALSKTATFLEVVHVRFDEC